MDIFNWNQESGSLRAGTLISMAVGLTIGVAICISGGEVFQFVRRIRFDGLGALDPISRANLTMLILVGTPPMVTINKPVTQ